MNGDSPTANIAFIDFRQANEIQNLLAKEECPDLADKPVVGNVVSVFLSMVPPLLDAASTTPVQSPASINSSSLLEVD